jgi:hypothetical protein
MAKRDGVIASEAWQSPVLVIGILNLICHLTLELRLTFELCSLPLFRAWALSLPSHPDSSHKVSPTSVVCGMIVKADSNVGREVCYEIQGEC